MSERRVVISGMGVVSPYGLGADLFWRNLKIGNSAVKMITDFDVSGLPTQFAAQVPLNDGELESHILNQKSTKTMSRATKMAVIAAQESVYQAELNPSASNPLRTGVSIGAGGLGLWDLDYTRTFFEIIAESNGQGNSLNLGKTWKSLLNKIHPLLPLKALPNMSAAHIAINHNARGVCQTISTACTSSAQAIGEAYRHIKFDRTDVMISGGCDSMINPNGLIAFSTLGVISKNNQEFETAARPFDRRRDGFMIGEGAAVFVLEEIEHCLRRDGKPLAEIIGYAGTCDAYRLTDEPAEAWGSIAAIHQAIDEGHINPDEVDLINAHGTGTQMNDINETYAIKKVFKEHAYHIPVNSSKSMIGHLVAAAGAIELAGCLKSMEEQIIHPTINYQVPDPKCDLDYVPNESRKKILKIILSNSFGFGGQNACLLIKKFE